MSTQLDWIARMASDELLSEEERWNIIAFHPSVQAMLAANPDLTQAARDFLRSFAVFRVEDDPGVRLSAHGVLIASHPDESPEALALLRFDAGRRAAEAALSATEAELAGILADHDSFGIRAERAEAKLDDAHADLEQLRGALTAMAAVVGRFENARMLSTGELSALTDARATLSCTEEKETGND